MVANLPSSIDQEFDYKMTFVAPDFESFIRGFAGKPGDELAPGTLNSVLKQAGLRL